MIKDRDEMKVFVLYLLDSIKYPLSRDVVHDISVQDGLITSFDYIDLFDELVEQEAIRIEEVDGKGNDLVHLTEKGKYIVDTLNGKLLASVKERTLKNALRLLSFKERGTRITSNAIQLPHGRYEFSFNITEDDGDLMNMKVTIENKRQLDKTMYNFEKNTEHIYKSILALLAGDASYLFD